MNGLHDKRKAVESPLVRRAAQSKPEASRLTKRAAEGRSPPPSAGDSTVSYVLRSRQVLVLNTSKPIVPSIATPAGPGYKTEKEPKDIPSRQTQTCAQLGLEHYNSVNQGDEHELVKPVESNAFIFNGVWIHANFLAKQIDATSCDGLVPKHFFAELKGDYEGLSCVSCVKMDPGVPRKLGGCGVCPRQIMHPVDGGYRNGQPFNDSATAGRCVYTF
ncbi:unnamed protein product [Urochloa decumbens]|uniref:DUF3615 domain-containing protein n=1 Tax=Urochloa decumbens TaxID=240449 RepID=A0ABC9HDP3_9POAL